MKYYDTYMKRLNRFGDNHWDRVQGEREKNFSLYLKRTVYRVSFPYNDEIRIGSLEPYRQTDTKILQYLLTPIGEELPVGTVLLVTNMKEEQSRWLVYYKEEIMATGYNRYIMIKMTNQITWTDQEGNQNEIWAYFYGQEDNMLKDEIKSRSRSNILYNENLKLSFFICPLNNKIKKEDYFEIPIVDMNGVMTTEAYRVTGFDKISTPGVEYVSVDPVYLYDLTPPPQPQPGEDLTDYEWLKMGGNSE